MVERNWLKPNSVVRGSMLAEPVRVTSLADNAKGVKLAGVGLRTGRAYELVLDQAQLAGLEQASAAEPGIWSPALDFYYLSEVLNIPVRREGEPQPLGRLYDIGASSATPYPLAVSLQVKARGGGKMLVPWSAVAEFGRRQILVRREASAAPTADFWVRRDVLDDQVVDVSGAKVVRVNDVHMLHTQGQLIMGHVEVGLLGLLRRLGVEKVACGLLHWLLDYTVRESFVTWKHVEVILPGGSPGGLRVSARPTKLAGTHPAELADILEELGVRERQTLMRSLPVETAAEALEEMEEPAQRGFILQEEPGKVADILEEMPAQEAAAVLRDVQVAVAESIMSRMETGAAEDVKTILSHGEESAGGVMATACNEAGLEEKAAEVLARVQRSAEDVEVFNHIYVLDPGRRLVGVLNLRELMRAAPDAAMKDVMRTDLVTLRPEEKLKDVTKLFAKYGFRAIPVVAGDGVFLGSVRLKSVLEDLSERFRE